MSPQHDGANHDTSRAIVGVSQRLAPARAARPHGSGPHGRPGGDPPTPCPRPRQSGRTSVREQRATLDSPRRHYSKAARLLFVSLDLVYGKRRTLLKFRVLELIARVPVPGVGAGRVHRDHAHVRTRWAGAPRSTTGSRRRASNRTTSSGTCSSSRSCSNATARRPGVLRSVVIPQAVAFVYYQLSWLLFVVRPSWSYRLNADFEDHAEHEYMGLVVEHPEWDDTAWSSDLTQATTASSTASPTCSVRSATTNGCTSSRALLGCGPARFRQRALTLIG